MRLNATQPDVRRENWTESNTNITKEVKFDVTYGTPLLLTFIQKKLLCTHPIRTTGIKRRPALMKKVIPPTNSPLSSVTVHVYSGLKISWLLKLHRLSRDARIAKRAPENKFWYYMRKKLLSVASRGINHQRECKMLYFKVTNLCWVAWKI